MEAKCRRKNIVIFGPPAAGKGTLSKYISDECGLLHISTGHIFRTEFYSNPKYKKLKEDLESGLFAPDKLASDVIKTYLDNNDISRGVIFDGYPRNLKQAKCFEKILSDRDMKIDYVFNLKISKDEISKRITGRFSCEECGTTYHKSFNPTKVSGLCDKCGSSSFSTREEDSIDAFEERMSLYIERTNSLIDYYKEEGLLKSIDASGTIKEVQTLADEFFSKK